MIDELHVRDVALIRDASLLPSTGLTVVTGETGSGKTALLSALALLAGGRGGTGAVREGADALTVEGRFVFPRMATRVPASASPSTYDAEEGEAIVMRQLTADGRSRVQINGSMASVGQLAEGIGASIDLCGQHEHQRLMHVANHREMLDMWALDDVLPTLEAYADAFEAAQAARAALDEVTAAASLSSEALEQARFTLARIDEVAPEEGEYDELRRVLARAEHAESLMRNLGGAHEALSGEGGALDAIGTAAAALDDAARTDEALAETAQSLREASYIIEDAARTVRSYQDTIDYDANDLARMQDRMGQLAGLLRSYGPSLDEVFATRQRAASTIAAVDESDAQLSRAKAALAKAEEDLAQKADELHRVRMNVAPQFSAAVSAQMQRLELTGSALECAVETQDRASWSLTGPDRVEFLFRPAEGLSARPLVKIASGGEISRVMLAIKVVLGAADDVDTLVFDEVDAGVGGSAARALADVLADLARTHQVIVVTHLPQVAVLGDVHYVVRKTTDAVPETTLEAVSGQARVAEVARMLSGDTGGVSRAHAAQMLEDAHHLH